MSKGTRVIFSLPVELQQALDEYCREHNYNRSEFLRHAIRTQIEKPKQKEQQDE